MSLGGLNFFELIKSLKIKAILNGKKTDFAPGIIILDSAKDANSFIQKSEVNAALLKPFQSHNFV